MLKIRCFKPRQYLAPLYSKQSIARSDLEKFENTLQDYLEKTKRQLAARQSEPNIVSNALKPFFESLGYVAQSHSQKGQSGIDLALIQEGEPAVIIEAKAPGSPGMIALGDINRKAFHEAVLYFMRERVRGNRSIYHIIITDFYRWFVFDAKEFERLFWQNKRVRKIFESVKNPSVLGNRTEDFYQLLSEEIASMQENLIEDREIEAACFDLKEPRNEKQNAALYKLFSKETILKSFNPNDANNLNKEFYNELLYIMGLEERKEGGKKIISRSRNPHMASLYENTTRNLEYAGYPTDFETVLRLNIIWTNRILFLKLLEAQLLRWNGGEERYRFLNIRTIEDFDRLKIFFFDILARPQEERGHKEYPQIPYLNSSLFEISPVEKRYIDISTLEDHCELPYYPKTVLKDASGRRRDGTVDMLQYLFEFLDAYDFASEGGEEIVAQNKTLINAAVLGLIFEKLNGYREGSYYTPSFVTMYMSRETIEKAVIEKFNHLKGWSCKNLDELDEKIEDKKEANEIINSLTICDPAVGSGHFLVSALNTILEIKSRLRILFDAEGRRIKDYTLEVKNDELLTRDDEGELFGYRSHSREKGRIQKAIFEEKKKIIENSLFGVDINPNAAQIARLRLWIELLKHSYYDHNGRLVTMPNIDINIKVGNSLVSRYGLHDEITIPNIRHKIEEYKALVREYKEGAFETTKAQMQQVIEEIKAMFGLTLQEQWKQTKRYNKLLYEYVKEFGLEGLSLEMQLDALKAGYGKHGRLFGDEIGAQGIKEREKMLKQLKDAHAQIEEIRAGYIYENAFEWRFEFPEVLDEEGNFVGFDLIIGNPPYFNIDVFGGGSAMLKYLPEHYPEIYMDKSDILFYFIERGARLSTSQVAYIISNAMLYSAKAKKLRNFILQEVPVRKVVNFERFKVFDEADITSMILFLEKGYKGPAKALVFSGSDYTQSEILNSLEEESNYFDVHLKEDAPFALIDTKIANLNEKIDGAHPKLGDLVHVGKGMETAANRVYTFTQIPPDMDLGLFKKKMSGDIIRKYIHDPVKEYLLYLENFEHFEELPENIQVYLLTHKEKLANRAEIKRNTNRQWWKYTFPMHKEYYQYPKIWTSYRAKENTFCLDESNEYIGLTNTTVIFGTNESVYLKYLLALLNSALLNFRYRSIGKQTGGEIYEYFEHQISKLPIPKIGKDMQIPFIDLVDQIIEKKKAGEATDEPEGRIDRMVYELYGLNNEEIEIVEGPTGSGDNNITDGRISPVISNTPKISGASSTQPILSNRYIASLES
ncbi:putative type IIS restriction/modification enzyme [Hydrogenimonas sp.]|nr:putative type IIS restriction/modification enzyme [Hydrogenimonas sp.]